MIISCNVAESFNIIYRYKYHSFFFFTFPYFILFYFIFPETILFFVEDLWLEASMQRSLERKLINIPYMYYGYFAGVLTHNVIKTTKK